MNPANYREALIETSEDEAEGADILLVGYAFLHLSDCKSLLRFTALLTFGDICAAGETWFTLFGYYTASP